ncbi:MAG: SH3 domain-containing protein [Chloroflexota bacterium]
MGILRRNVIKRPAQVAAILTVMVVVSILSTGAAVRGTQNFNLTCTGFESNGGQVILNRDNTGFGAERIALLATDGNGTVIYGPVVEELTVGTSMEYPRGLFETWSEVPAANPLFFTITSEAGNGFARETVYRRSGNCRDIDTQTGVTLTSRTAADAPPSLTLETDESNESTDAPVDVDDLADLLGLTGTGTVNAGRLNVRTGDGIQYRAKNVFTRGTPVNIIGRNEAATWWYVESGVVRGWVSADFVILEGDLQYQDVATSDVLPRGEQVFPRFIFYQDYPVYAQPTPVGEQLCVLAGNVEYNVLGRTDNWQWYRVQVTCNGAPLTAWAEGRLGALRRYGQDVPVIQ